MLEVSKFTHSDLESQGCIRLVRVNTDKQKDLLICELVSYSLDEEHKLPEYRALSYTWGADTETCQVLLNDKHWRLSRTLYDFLSIFARDTKIKDEPLVLESGNEESAEPELSNNTSKNDRQHGWTEFLWIDQLSINQDDAREKSHQVAMMATIYTRAAEVIIWLDNRQEKSKYQPFDHPYWTRLWVVQEYLLASKRTIYLGDRMLGRVELLCAVSDMGIAMKNTMNLYMLGTVPPPRGHTFHRSINNFADHKCKDLRDKVYGILALSGTSIEVDYSKSVNDIFWDAVLELLRALANEVASRKIVEYRQSQCENIMEAMFRLAYNMMPQKWAGKNKDCDIWVNSHAQKFVIKYCTSVWYEDMRSTSVWYEDMRELWAKVLNSFFLEEPYCAAPCYSQDSGWWMQCNCFE